MRFIKMPIFRIAGAGMAAVEAAAALKQAAGYRARDGISEPENLVRTSILQAARDLEAMRIEKGLDALREAYESEDIGDMEQVTGQAIDDIQAAPKEDFIGHTHLNMSPDGDVLHVSDGAENGSFDPRDPKATIVFRNATMKTVSMTADEVVKLMGAP